MPSGEVVIRPSSKGVNHITVSYKVTGSAVAHIDVSEEEKRARDEFSLGKKLVIGKEHFESLDELLAT
jgi:transcription elongation factor SPT6